MADEASSSSNVSSRFRSSSAVSDDKDENVGSPVEDEGKIQKEPEEEGKIQKELEEEGNKLKREVGLFSAVMLIVGSLIGSGIFISPKGVLQYSGSVGACLLVWTLCGGVALMGALCYAELGTAIPVSGAEYSYFLYIYGTKGRFGPIPAFLYLWMCSLIIKTTTVAVQLLTFAEYIVEPMFPACPTPGAIKKLVALIAICFITFINCYSVKMTTRMNNVFTIAKLVAIAIVVSVGAYMLSKGNYHHLIAGFKGATSYSELGNAFYFGLWAYDSWNNLNFVTEELIDPHINLPRSIMIGIPLVTVCYVLTNISYFTVLSPDEVLASDAVAVGFADYALGPAAFIIPILVAASAFGASNGTCLIASRLPFAAAREGHWAELMSYVQLNHLTPAPALIFNGLIISIMICAGNIAGLIDLFSFVAWMFYGGSMVSVIVLRFTEKDLPRPYKVPLIIPIIMSVISAYLVLAPLIFNPQLEYFYAFVFLLSGLLLYIPFIHYGLRLRIMKKITHVVQLLLVCAPSESVPD
ncbi:b(0,+)-type amino acid transporter 1 [Araneus ventricosus]|uniref:b(0,+)-type amino acid transporter 1 n=1 Tax=Araneus ventricosus TaxID=182803 RepID=A0A4Y2G8Q6_ARAVE|nr:b(0,+)-type amino acid transporter 1 [Araneus ventricosus]